MKINLEARTNSTDFFITGPAVVESKRGIRYLESATLESSYDMKRGIVTRLVVDIGGRVVEYVIDEGIKIDTDNSIVEFNSRTTRYKIRELRDADMKRILGSQALSRAEKS